MQRAEDDLERGLVREARVRVDRHAAAVVADGEREVGVELDLDAVGVAGDRLVHGVVEDLGDEVVQRPLVGAADVHAGALAYRLEAFEHLDGAGVVGAGCGVVAEEVGGVHHAGPLFVFPAIDSEELLCPFYILFGACGKEVHRRGKGRRWRRRP